MECPDCGNELFTDRIDEEGNELYSCWYGNDPGGKVVEGELICDSVMNEEPGHFYLPKNGLDLKEGWPKK